MQEDQPTTPCPLVVLWAGIFERDDRTAAEALSAHARECLECQTEIARLSEIVSQQPGIVEEWFGNCISGAKITAVIGAIMAGWAIGNVFNQAVHDMGGKPPFWFRPIRPGPREQGKK